MSCFFVVVVFVFVFCHFLLVFSSIFYVGERGYRDVDWKVLQAERGRGAATDGSSGKERERRRRKRGRGDGEGKKTNKSRRREKTKTKKRTLLIFQISICFSPSSAIVSRRVLFEFWGAQRLDAGERCDNRTRRLNQKQNKASADRLDFFSLSLSRDGGDGDGDDVKNAVVALLCPSHTLREREHGEQRQGHAVSERARGFSQHERLQRPAGFRKKGKNDVDDGDDEKNEKQKTSATETKNGGVRERKKNKQEKKRRKKQI